MTRKPFTSLPVAVALAAKGFVACGEGDGPIPPPARRSTWVALDLPLSLAGTVDAQHNAVRVTEQTASAVVTLQNIDCSTGSGRCEPQHLGVQAELRTLAAEAIANQFPACTQAVTIASLIFPPHHQLVPIVIAGITGSSDRTAERGLTARTKKGQIWKSKLVGAEWFGP
jgi:hypothetical protein